MSLFDQLLHNYFYHIRNLFNNKDSKHQIRLLFCCNFDNFVFFPFGINLKITARSQKIKTIVGEPLTLLFQTPKHVHYTISTSTFVCLEDSLVPNHHQLP